MATETLENLFALRAKTIPETPDEVDLEGNVIDFTFGHPDPSNFPVEYIEAAIKDVLRNNPVAALQYSNFRGSEALLDALAVYLFERIKIPIDNQNIIVTNGSMQVLGLAGRIFIDPGDVVLTEAPTYFRAVSIFQKCDAQVVDIHIDAHGLCVESLEDRLKKLILAGKKPKFLYTIPTHQNPSGISLTTERRHALLNICSHYGILVLEDTAYNDLWYDVEPPSTLYELDSGAGTVIQMGTFSKLMAPGLAIGWAIGPKSVVTRFVEFKDNGGTTPFTSHIAATFLGMRNFNQHLNRLRLSYKQKRDTVIKALEDQMQDIFEWEKPGGGYFVWLKPKDDYNQSVLWKNAIKEKVLYLPGRYCYANNIEEHTAIRLAFSSLSLAAIEDGIRRLNIAIRKTL